MCSVKSSLWLESEINGLWDTRWFLKAWRDVATTIASTFAASWRLNSNWIENPNSICFNQWPYRTIPLENHGTWWGSQILHNSARQVGPLFFSCELGTYPSHHCGRGFQDLLILAHMVCWLCLFANLSARIYWKFGIGVMILFPFLGKRDVMRFSVYLRYQRVG